MIKVDIMVMAGGKMPQYMTDGAACADCYAREAVIIEPGKREKVPLGFALGLPLGYEAVIRPRSSLSLRGIDSAEGTIDSDYRGEVSAMIINNTFDSYKIEPGARICQMKIQRAEQIGFIPCESLPETRRGDGGWGSTGTY